MVRRLAALIIAFVIVTAGCDLAPPSSSPSSPLADPSAGASPITQREHDPPAVIAACIQPPQPTGPEFVDLGGRYAPIAGPDGGSIVIGDRHASSRFDPLQAETVGDLTIAAATWSGLGVGASDLTFVPDLADQDIPTLENGRVLVPGIGGFAMSVIWCLKSGLRWSDGVALTCDDFEFARRWVETVSSEQVRARYGDLRVIACPASDVLVAQYGTIFSSYYRWMVPPLPRRYLESFSLTERRSGAAFTPEKLPALPVSGAFEFVSVSPEAVVLARNPYYVGGHRGEPAHIESVEFRWYASDDALIKAFRAGEVDLAANLDQTLPDSLEATTFAESVQAVPSLRYETLRLNWSSAAGSDGTGGCSLDRRTMPRGVGCPIADQAVRFALAQAIDATPIQAALGGAFAQFPGGIVAPDSYFFNDEPPTAFNPIAAGKTLDQAGWQLGADGIRVKNGLRASVELCTTADSRHVAAARLIADNAAGIGIAVLVHPVSETQLLAPHEAVIRTSPCAVSRGNFDLALEPLVASMEPSDYLARYASTAFEPAGRNDARVSDSEIDAALHEAVETVDFVVTKRAMARFQHAAVASVLEIPLVFLVDLDLVPSQTTRPILWNFFSGESVPITWNAADWVWIP